MARNLFFLIIIAGVFLLLTCVAEAQTLVDNTPKQDSTESTEPIGWKAGPRGRGTLALLINCLVTLFLCVWTTVHVNIEPARISNRVFSRYFSKLRNDTIDRWLAARWIRKLGWSIVSLVFPEAMVALAMFENKTAHMLRAEMLELGKKIQPADAQTRWKERWDDITLSYFVVMGGFRIDPPPKKESEGEGAATQGVWEDNKEQGPPVTPDIEGDGRSQEAPPLEIKGENGLIVTNSASLAAQDHATDFEMSVGCTLTPHGVLFLAKQPGGFRSQLIGPQVRDRSKAGTLAKVIVVFQAIWMVLQVLARTAAGLEVALLEVHVILHVLCSLCMYAIWWGKPVDLELQETVYVTPDELDLLQKPATANPTNPFEVKGKTSDEEAQAQVQFGEVEDKRHTDGYLITRGGLGKLLYIQLCDKRSLLTDYFPVICRAFGRLIESRRKIWKEGMALCAIALAYGGAHLSTWNNDFFTLFERWMWRSAAMLTAVSMGFFVLSLYFGAFLKRATGETDINDKINRGFRMFCGISLGVGIVPVVFARIFLFVECFIVLRGVPRETYDTIVWAGALPGFG